jgi:UDP-N-acetylglucosamine--N-acetylmuramyl-(pentapeptide) pyrophosphoryl-undecaprenol N-acetylglucosamine transferase
MRAAMAGAGHPQAAQTIVAMIHEAEASRRRSGGRHAAH